MAPFHTIGPKLSSGAHCRRPAPTLPRQRGQIRGLGSRFPAFRGAAPKPRQGPEGPWNSMISRGGGRKPREKPSAALAAATAKGWPCPAFCSGNLPHRKGFQTMGRKNARDDLGSFLSERRPPELPPPTIPFSSPSYVTKGAHSRRTGPSLLEWFLCSGPDRSRGYGGAVASQAR